MNAPLAAQPKKRRVQLHLDLDGLLESACRSKDSMELIKSMLILKNNDKQWRGIIATPPGTLLDSIISEFRLKTNIPLEIPFFVFMI